MKTFSKLTAGVAILLALAGPSLAASRVHRGMDAYASGTADRSGAYYYGPRGGQAYGRAYEGEARVQPQYDDDGHIQYNRGQNLPYPDRPYGDPDSW
jgi:hypothetical protein